MNILLKISLGILLVTGIVLPVQADIAVIVNRENTQFISKEEVSDIFLGKIKTFNNGLMAYPINIIPNNELRKIFNSALLLKTESQLSAYWARMMFSSKGKPPVEVTSSQEVIKIVNSNISAIGYVDTNDLIYDVRVLFYIK